MKLLLFTLILHSCLFSSDSSSGSSDKISISDEKSTATTNPSYERYCKDSLDKNKKPISYMQWDKNNKQFIEHLKAYDFEALKKLLESEEVDINSRFYHWTPLMWAAKEDREDLVKLLLEHHADINIEDENGGTALTWAECYGNDKIVNLLKKYSDL